MCYLVDNFLYQAMSTKSFDYDQLKSDAIVSGIYTFGSFEALGSVSNFLEPAYNAHQALQQRD